MVLNKLFAKKDKYFLEIETKTTEQPQGETVTISEDGDTEVSSNEVSVNPPSLSNVADDVPEWVKAIKNYSNTAEAETVEVENFAGKYISNNVSFSRRRPGPSLAPFKSMASKMGK